jgi:hypothetical protein
LDLGHLYFDIVSDLELRISDFAGLGIFTLVKNPLQIAPFMQNKPNFRKAKMNVTSFITNVYENVSNWKLGENKANTKPNKANLPAPSDETNPIQTQYKPNQTQFQRRRTGERYKKTPEWIKEMIEKVPVYKACEVVLSDVAVDCLNQPTKTL